MIGNFRHRGLERFFRTGSKAGIQPKHAEKLRLQLFALDNAQRAGDMDAPGWKLHVLSGELKDHWAISVSGNWRLTFKFEGEDVVSVITRTITDQHLIHGLRTAARRKAMHNPPHPGLVLREYLGDLGVTKAAAHLKITRVTLSRVLNGKSGISASMAIRLAAALGTTAELWMNMQSQYDLWQARQTKHPAIRRLAQIAKSAGEEARTA